MESPPLTNDDLQAIYEWVDSIPVSRPKRNIARDFSDGVMLAEIVHHYFPKLVELHNYSNASSVRQKLYNWSTLNQKVFKKLNYEMREDDIKAAVNCKPGAIESILAQVQHTIMEYQKGKDGHAPVSPTAAGRHELSEGGPHSSTTSAAAYSSGGGGGGGASNSATAHHSDAGAEAAVAERDATITELRETVDILELKVQKLEQLIKLKDGRIQTLLQKLQAGATAGGGGH